MDFLIKLQNIFLGLVSTEEPEEEDREETKGINNDSDEDVDGVPLDGNALMKAGAAHNRDSDDSLDGEPIRGKTPDMSSSTPAAAKSGGFVTSKWETVDPEDVRAGAMTTSKWEQEETDQLIKARKALMGSVASKWDDKEEDIDGDPLNNESDQDYPDVDTRVTEERRQLLRDIEVKVMQYQDELEGGRKGIKSGWTISEQVEHYRKKLLRRAQEREEENDEAESDSQDRSSRSDRDKDRNKKKKRRRSRSGSSSRSRSREKEKKSRRRRRSSDSDNDSRRRDRSRDKRSRSRSRSRDRRQSKRQSRSRSRSPRKHKKKRH